MFGESGGIQGDYRKGTEVDKRGAGHMSVNEGELILTSKKGRKGRGGKIHVRECNIDKRGLKEVCVRRVTTQVIVQLKGWDVT